MLTTADPTPYYIAGLDLLHDTALIGLGGNAGNVSSTVLPTLLEGYKEDVRYNLAGYSNGALMDLQLLNNTIHEGGDKVRLSASYREQLPGGTRFVAPQSREQDW